MAGQENSKLIAVNRKARHDYFVMEAMEAGVELVGTEVKSIRTGAVNLKDSWVEIDGGELYVLGMHISPYEKGNIFNRDPVRKRKLLVHKREIKHLQEQKKPDESKADFKERTKDIKHPIIEKMFREYAPKYNKHKAELGQGGGYTRIVKKGPRRGDGAEMVILELV